MQNALGNGSGIIGPIVTGLIMRRLMPVEHRPDAGGVSLLVFLAWIGNFAVFHVAVFLTGLR